MVYMATKYMKHVSKASNLNFITFILVFILAIGFIALAISYVNKSAFAQVGVSSSEPTATNPEVPFTDAIDAEANDLNVNIYSEGKGSITPVPSPFTVEAGTQFKVYGNELSIAGNTYTANFDRGYYFLGWYVNGTRVDVLGTITSDTTIVAKFTSDVTSCMISGKVEYNDAPFTSSGFVYAVSETSHKVVGSATAEDGEFTLKVPRNEAVTIVALTTNGGPLAGNTEPISSDKTSEPALDLSATPIKLLDTNPENCWLSGRFTCNGPVKDAAITCLWDEGQSGVYDFHSSTCYTNDTGIFLLKGKNGVNSYILYNGPGIRMSVRRLSSTLTSYPARVISWNIKPSGHSVYLEVPEANTCSYDINLATTDCSDVINTNFNSTINLGIDDGTSVKFSGNTLTYNMHDDIDPWNESNDVNVKYSITAKPNNNKQFYCWLVDGKSVADGAEVKINQDTKISAYVKEDVQINGLVLNNTDKTALEGAKVSFLSSDYSRTYASAVSDSEGKFTWDLPAEIHGKLIAVFDGYKTYDEDYISTAGNLTIRMEPEDPPVQRYFVSGKISENDGTPVNGALVTYVSQDGNNTYRTTSGYDGSYMLELKYGQSDGVLIVYKDLYIQEFVLCGWDSPDQYLLEKNIKLLKSSEGAATYFGIAENQASFDLSLYYNGDFVTSATYTEPFTLYFKDYSLKEDGDTLYLEDLNELFSGFTYKLTSTPVSEDYIFQRWDIKTYDEENAKSRIDVKPVYVSSVVPDPEPEPDPGTGGGVVVNAQTGDNSLVAINIVVCAILFAACGIFASQRRIKVTPKHCK